MRFPPLRMFWMLLFMLLARSEGTFLVREDEEEEGAPDAGGEEIYEITGYYCIPPTFI